MVSAGAARLPKPLNRKMAASSRRPSAGSRNGDAFMSLSFRQSCCTGTRLEISLSGLGHGRRVEKLLLPHKAGTDDARMLDQQWSQGGDGGRTGPVALQ